MFKKLLSLYGLCFFNLGATLGEYLTQCELEEFLCHYRDGAEATWDVVFVNVRAPEMPEFFTPGEWEKTIEKFVSFDEQVNGFYLGLSYEDLIGKECIYKTITLKTPEAIAAWSELTKNKDAEIKSLCTSGTVASEPPCKTKRTDPRTPFFKYSRPLESGKKSVFDEWHKQQFPGSGIPNVRIIDYESILAGSPELKEEADRLMDSLKTDDQKYLRDAIRAKWFNEQKPILVRIQIISGSEETYTEFLYKPNLSVLDTLINRLYYTLGHKETVYQQNLILALLLSKNLRFVIDNTEGEVGCYTSGDDTLNLNLSEGWLNRAVIYHELNHALHYYLGMVGAFFLNQMKRVMHYKKNYFSNIVKKKQSLKNLTISSQDGLDNYSVINKKLIQRYQSHLKIFIER